MLLFQVEAVLISHLMSEVSQSQPSPSGRPRQPKKQEAQEAPSLPSVPAEAASQPRRMWGEYREISTSDFPGSARARAALNRALQKAWNIGDPTAWLTTRVRCEVLKLTPQQFKRAGSPLSVPTVRRLETGRTNGRTRKYEPQGLHELLKTWRAIGRKHKDPSVKALLKDAESEFLKLVTPAHAKGVHGLLCRWRIEVGPTAFERRSGLNYKTMWARARQNAVASFGSLLSLGREVGVIERHSSAQETLADPKVKELASNWIASCMDRNRLEVVCKLHVLLDVAGIELEPGKLGTDVREVLQGITAVDLAKFKFVPWAKVKTLCDFLERQGVLSGSDKNALASQWRSTERSLEPSFESKLASIAKERGLSNINLAAALGLEKPQVAKPSHQIARALKYGDSTTVAPLGVLTHLIVDDPILRESLLDQKRREIVLDWQREGSAVSSPIAVERHLWAVSVEDLPFQKRQVQRLEWDLSSPLNPEEVLTEIRRIGLERAQAAESSLKRRFSLDTVRDTFKSIERKLNGLARTGRNLNTAPTTVTAIISGEEVPSLPRLKNSLTKAGLGSLTEQLEADWREANAQQLLLRHQCDMERVLLAHASELTDSKNKLFQAKRRLLARSARALSRLSDTGITTKIGLSQMLRVFQVKAGSPPHSFMKILAQSGSVPQAVAHWIGTQEDPTEVRERLRSWTLRTPSKNFVGPTQQPSRTLAEELAVIRRLPGVTRGEIVQALFGGQDAERRLLHRLAQGLGTQGIKVDDVLYATLDNITVQRPPTALHGKSYRRRIPTPRIPVGVMVHLRAPNSKRLGRMMKAARDEIRNHLLQSGVPASAAAVEMRLWRVRPEDLAVPKQLLTRALHGRQGDEFALRQIEFVARQKLERTMLRLWERRTAIAVPVVAKVAEQITPGRSRVLSVDLSLPLGGIARYQEGLDVPTLKTLTDIALKAALPTTVHMEREWYMACANYLAQQGANPLFRSLLTHIASQIGTIHDGATPLVYPHSIGKGTSVSFGLTKVFAFESSLDGKVFAPIFSAAEQSGRVGSRDLSRLTQALSIGDTSLAASFLRKCSDQPSMVDAIVGWWQENRDNPVIKEGWEKLLLMLERTEYLTDGRGPQIESVHRASQEAVTSRTRTLALRSLPKTSEVEEEITHALAGATRAEIFQAAAAITKFLREEERLRELEKEQDWRITEQMKSLPVAEKLGFVQYRLERGLEVSISDLLSLFHERSSSVLKLNSVLVPDTAWYLASLGAFKQPEEALAAMVTEISKGLVPRHQGREHFEQAKRWLEERGSLGKLNEASIPLFFKEKIVLEELERGRR